MKRIALVLAGLLFLGGVAANAQGFVVKLGYNYANFDKSITIKDMKSGHSGWQLGLGYQTETSSGFSFQPELVYKVSGYSIPEAAANLRVGYLEVPLNVQWGPDLWVARPYIFAGPYLGFKLTQRFDNNEKPDIQQTISQQLNKAEFGLGVGLGINIYKFQIAGKYNWNFGKLSKLEMSQFDKDNISKTIAGAPRTFEISVGLKF